MKKITPVLIVLFYCTMQSAYAQWDSIANFNQVIFDMKVFNNNLFIGGGFTKSNAQNCYWSAYYNGSTITRHTTMIAGTGIDDLEVFNGELYAVGGLTFSSTIGVGVWDGSTWQDGGSTNYSHSIIYAHGNELFTQSDDGIIRKKTGSGSFQPFYDFAGNGGASAMGSYNGNLIVAGSFSSIGGVTANNIALWNGSTWQALGSGVSTGVACMAVFNGELYVAGGINNAGGVAVNNIAKWNGSSWSDVGGGYTGSNFNGIRDMVVYGSSLIVVGDIDEMGGVSTGNVAAWNGSQWSGLGLTHDDSFVQCAQVFNNQLYVGTFDFNRSHVFKYNGIVGIDEPATATLVNIYPNPFSNEITLTLSDNSEAAVIIYDFLARQLLQQSFTNSTTINTGQFADGIYFYELHNDKGMVRKGKIIKQ